MIDLPPGTHIWIAAGFTDMRRGFLGLSTMVETALKQAPYSGHVFVFRGKRGDLVKVLWFDGDGLCLLQKRLERGRFICRKPQRERCHSRVRSYRCCFHPNDEDLSLGTPARGH